MKPALALAAVWLLFAAKLPAAGEVNIPVHSPAFVFSPGNWTGDSGRGGERYRQTWNSGAYFRVTWETTSATPSAKLLLDTSTYPEGFRPPTLIYRIDGVWKPKRACQPEVIIEGLAGAGKHELVVYLQSSQQVQRWGSPGQSPVNVLRVTGLQVDAAGTPVPGTAAPRWAWIIGDSITEGIGASELAAYSHLTGQALQTQGYEYAINACGWSGWINKGDNPPGDVPGFYVVTNSTTGEDGQYDEAASRWNKVDGNNHSLLDAKGHLSGYGQENQEPSLILINYGTNDALHKSNPLDTQASIVQSLAALRKSAPEATIVLLVPFGQYYARELKRGVILHHKNHAGETRMAVIDLGPAVATNLAAKDGVFGGLHPNDRGHANFAAQLIPRLLSVMEKAR